MPRLFWEDFAKGSVAEYGPRLITREEILDFAGEFDPQPHHLDDQAARAALLGGLAASGWHTCCLLMRMIADGFILEASSMGSPGVEEVRWLAPVHPGDRLIVRATVIDTRASNSRPGMGLTTFRYDMFNDSGVVVLELTSTLMLGRRSGGAAA